MSLEKHKISIERKGVNHVKIFKLKQEAQYENYWNFTLKGDDEPLIIKEFYTDSKFIIVNWSGWIRAFDVDTKEMILDHNLNVIRNAKAVFSLDKTKLYVAFTEGKNYVATIDLDTLKITITELPDEIFINALQIRKDGCLLFYEITSKYANGKEIFKHFYSVLDLNTATMEKFELPFTPHSDFDSFIPVIDVVNNMAILPTYEDVLVKTDHEGENLFEFKINFLDLNTFESTALFVRDFTKRQLSCSDYDSEDMAEKFISLEKDDEYYEAAREFYDNLNTIKVVEDGIWLCWNGGILRKINKNSILSPLLVTSILPDSTVTGMFSHLSFLSELYAIDNSVIVLETYNTNYYKAKMPVFDPEQTENPVALEFMKTSLEDLFGLNYSDNQKQEIEELDFIKIEVEDLTVKEGFTQALLQIENVVSDLDALGIGSILLFIIKDRKGKSMEEPEFFAEAIKYEPKLIESIIEKFIQNRNAKYIYRHAEETALCHAVFELAKKGDKHITTVLKYLAAIDLDHDVFNIENTFPVLQETFTTSILSQKMKSISEELGEWYEYYLEEFE